MPIWKIFIARDWATDLSNQYHVTFYEYTYTYVDKKISAIENMVMSSRPHAVVFGETKSANAVSSRLNLRDYDFMKALFAITIANADMIKFPCIFCNVLKMVR